MARRRLHQIALLLTLGTTLSGQWINYPTPGIPRTKDGKPNLTAPAPRTSEGKMDLTGVWALVRKRGIPIGELPNIKIGLPGISSVVPYMPVDTQLPFTPWGASLYQARFDDLGRGSPAERCLPHGIPRVMVAGGAPFRIVQTPGITVMLFEEYIHFRTIFSDGRSHPSDPEPAWYGYSVGRWDGDTFVVDTRGFNEQTWLDGSGHPHSRALRTIERFKRKDFGHMEIEFAIDDPIAYEKPWSMIMSFTLLADTELMEQTCDNEKDVQHMLRESTK